jgi:Lrp/AsnC family transcriptional regulator for asnA, asnC and gidA
MSEIDAQILRELMKNAQTPFSRIAKKLGISSSTVKKRYEKMKNEGTIMQSSIRIDLSKLGYQGKVFLMITNAPKQDKSTTINALKRIPNVFVITEIIGDCDVLAIAPVIDLKSIKALVDEIKKVPSVDLVEVALIDDTAFPINSRFDESLTKKR